MEEEEASFSPEDGSNEYGQLDESLKSEVASSSFTCVQQQTAWLPLEKLISAPRCVPCPS